MTIESIDQLLYVVAKILNDLKIPYAVTGGIALTVWGNPRYTADIDIVLELMPQNISLLVDDLMKIDKDVYVSKEAIEDALRCKGEFNFIHPQSGTKVDFWIKSNDFYDKLEMKRAIARDIDGQKIIFVSPEDLILSKLIWHKETESSKQLDDIKTVLNNKEIKLDLEYIKNWAKKQSTIDILNKIILDKN